MKKQNFNANWLFSEGGGSSLQALVGGAAKPPRKLTLPHDASIEMERNPKEEGGSGNGYFQEKSCNYTKTFSLPKEDADQNILLEFEGVYQNAFVYVNGAFAGQCPYGYSNFYVDMTDLVTFDEPNQVKVIVKNGVPSGRWYTGGGIYRDVNLLVADHLHISPDGVRLATLEIEDTQAIVRVETDIEYTGTGVRDVLLKSELIDRDGNVAASDIIPVTVMTNAKNTYRQKLYVANAQLWDADNPYLYTYRTTLLEGENTTDEESGTFGIRLLQLDPRHGLRVNGRVTKLRGGCIHHDNGITGTAEFKHTAEFRVKKLKEAGFNAIRSSHYPMSRHLLRACDTYGMYVMDEFSDVWTTSKVDFDYGIHMAGSWEHDVKNLVRKDYNHPCVIMYSIGNEIPETGNKFDVQLGKKLADTIRALDDSRFVTNSLNLLLAIMDKLPKLMAGMDSGAAQTSQQETPMEINSAMTNMADFMNQLVASDFAGDAIREAAAQVDLVGYNYAAFRYEKDSLQYPGRILVGSETYPQDLDVNWELTQKLPNVIGDFDWTAWDYLGEAGIGKIWYGTGQAMSFYAPYPCKAAYCGDINLLGDARPIAYWRELIWESRTAPYLCAQPPRHFGETKQMSQWTMTDALRSWNFAGFEGKPIIVELYAKGDEAELFVNQKSVGRKPIGETKKYITYFETLYEPGTVEAVVYEDGKEVGRDKIVTAGSDVTIHAFADAASIPSDGSDIAYVEISLQDKDGNLNPDIVKSVSIKAEGPAEIIGFGSADPESEENYFDTSARTYEGRLKAAVRGMGEKGRAIITLSSEGLDDVKVSIDVV